MKEIMSGFTNMLIFLVLLGAFLVAMPQIAYKIGKRTGDSRGNKIEQQNVELEKALNNALKRLEVLDEIIEENEYLRRVNEQQEHDNNVLRKVVDERDLSINQLTSDNGLLTDEVTQIKLQLVAEEEYSNELSIALGQEHQALLDENAKYATIERMLEQMQPVVNKMKLREALAYIIALLVILFYHGKHFLVLLSRSIDNKPKESRTTKLSHLRDQSQQRA